MNKNIIIGAIIAFVVIGAFALFINQKPQQENSNSSSQTQSENISEGKMVAGYNGKVLAGTASPYLDFKKADYEKAKSSGKVILLDFYANWCPICRAEAPEIDAGFNSLNSDKVVGFRVNFNDSDTDEDEKSLASEFKIPYQHTKLILVDGKEVSRSTDQWTRDSFLAELNKYL